MEYRPTQPISLDGEANPRNADLTSSEVKRGYRTIGGDKGDLHFKGYTLEDGRTTLYQPWITTTLEDLTEDEVNEIAQEILDFSFDSIGFESVE